MMFIELQARFFKKPNKDIEKEIDALIETEKILKGGDFDEDEYRKELLAEKQVYEYDNMVVDLSEMFSFNRVDDENTNVKFMNGVSYVFKISYEEFMVVFVNVTQNTIKQIKND